ncbi:MAG: hypothetical protein RL291_506 [Pseudomonadota bacterium]
MHETKSRNPIGTTRRSPRMALALVALAFGLLPSAAEARKDEVPASSDSVLGNYLTGRVARGQLDTRLAASRLRAVLEKDRDNDALMAQAFELDVIEGNWERAVPAAERLATLQPQNRVARMMMGLIEFRRSNFDSADGHFKAASVNPVGELTGTLARAWTAQAKGNSREALDLLEKQKLPDWAQAYVRYHRALLLDVSARPQEARAIYERIAREDPRTLRTALAYAKHAGHQGDFKLSQQALANHLERARGEPHPVAQSTAAMAARGERADLIVMTVNEGLAEVFYGLGEALTNDGGVTVGKLYLQLALYLEPVSPFPLVALANIYEQAKQHDRAIETYDRVPRETPFDVPIEVRKALNLDQLSRTDEAQARLEDIAKRNPNDLRPLDALGNMLRGHKKFAEAAEVYTRAIALIKKPEPRHWSYFYARGMSYERTKRWPLAETDFQQALKLSPNEALVLNYLGYSWVDQGKNLREGMALIEQAVRLRPDDGFIVDSLGWAHYKLGNYAEAVRQLERAVELSPQDPTLNDHLGDALWRVGREREARFQWEQALTLKPDPEDETKIREKIERGMARDERTAPGQSRTPQAPAKSTAAPQQKRSN